MKMPLAEPERHPFLDLVRIEVRVLEREVPWVQALYQGAVWGLGSFDPRHIVIVGIAMVRLMLRQTKDLQIPETEVYPFRPQHTAAKFANKVATTLVSFLPSTFSLKDRNGIIAVIYEECQVAYEIGGVQEVRLTLFKETIRMIHLIVYHRIKALLPQHYLLR